MGKTNLLVVEGSLLARDGLRLILLDAAYRVSEAGSARDYLSGGDVAAPDLVLWGPSISVQSLALDLEAIRSRLPTVEAVRLVALTSEARPPALRRLAALDLDAILLDDISSDVLRRSLDLVILGQQLYPPARRAMSKVRLNAMAAIPPRPPLAVSEIAIPMRDSDDVVLSWRESQILMQLRDGVPNKTIAKNLGIAEATVKVHVKSLFRKLGATNRTQAALWALNNRYRVMNAVMSGKAGPGRASVESGPSRD